MPHYLILTEKPSARRNFEQALGGSRGTFAGFSYELANLRGHVMTLKEPAEQVPATLKQQYSSWKLADLPWDVKRFTWQRTYLKSKNPRTGRQESSRTLLQALKQQVAAGVDGIVIATDNDPSGEGELLAWEALDAIHWQGPVLRAYFVDESKQGIQKALRQLVVIEGKEKDAAYQKGLARNKWDFASMQLTRAATTASRQQGFQFVSRQGRLKSAMIARIYQQLQAIENYQRIPYFENRYRDDQGHLYARAVPKDGEQISFRYPDKATALAHFQDQVPTGKPVVLSQAIKQKQPPRLLDLSTLSAQLAKFGYSAKSVLVTYQKMYENQLVSYPRTADKTITPDQFQELLPLVDQMAQLVGINRDLLTHRQARASHVQTGGSHGANRPGPQLPSNLASLKKYGTAGPKIYELLAKNFLAMFAENYRYRQTKAAIQEAPDFQTTINEPVAAGWQALYQTGDKEVAKPMGSRAELFVYEGQNPKPITPTWSWLKAFLEKYDIGTGATRTSTYADLSTGPAAYIRDQKGQITLSSYGRAAAHIIQGTYIAHPKTTKRIFDIFDQVGRFELSADQALESLNITVAHDLPVIMQNAQTLPEQVTPPAKKKYPKKEKVTGFWAPKQAQVSFSKSFAGHTFTDVELAALLAGQTISFPAKKKRGGSFTAKGHLAEKRFRGKPYVGFTLLDQESKA